MPETINVVSFKLKREKCSGLFLRETFGWFEGRIFPGDWENVLQKDHLNIVEYLVGGASVCDIYYIYVYKYISELIKFF